MLCTKCSEEIKPVVAIDIDGTLGDYHGHFLAFASAYLGREVSSLFPPYRGRGSFRIWAYEAYQIDDATWRQIKLAYRQGAQKRSMPAYPDASYLCEHVRRCDAELWLTTTRPYLRLDGIDPDTRAWLNRHEIEYDGLLYDEDKYAVLASRIDRQRVVAVLDDLPEQFEAAASAFSWRTPILARNPYNLGVACEQDARNLDSARLQIVKRIYEWKEQHEGDSSRST